MSGGPTERHLRVQRTARYFLLGAPSSGTREVWIACHGYGQLASSFASALVPLGDAARVVAVPEALSRFYLDDPAKRHGPDSPIGASWMTREDRELEIEDYVAYLDGLAEELRDETSAKMRFVGLGFSQGAATISRWAAMGRTRLHRVIIWGGTLPHDIPASGDPFRGASVVLVGGRKDALTPPEAIERDRHTLAERGIRAAVLMHDGAHALSSATLKDIAALQ